MKRIILSQNESNDLHKIVKNFRYVGDSLQYIQDDLLKLEEKKNILLEELENIKSDEHNFFNNLEKTYGEGKLDPLTLEYIIK